MPADVRRKWTPDGNVVEVMRPSNKGNGMTYDADLNLLVCEHATSSVARIRPNGTREVLASHFEGKELNSPNDIVVRSDGRIYFTDPTYGRMPGFGVERPLQQAFRGVYMLHLGHKPGDEPILVSDRYTFTQPNGLCFSPCLQCCGSLRHAPLDWRHSPPAWPHRLLPSSVRNGPVSSWFA